MERISVAKSRKNFGFHKMALVELESVPSYILAMVALCLLQEHRLFFVTVGIT